MLSKCANPACSTPLVYLREGKIFMMDNTTRSGPAAQGPVPLKNMGRVEHFWLCGPCSEQLTLVYCPGGVKVVPKVPSARRAVAS